MLAGGGGRWGDRDADDPYTHADPSIDDQVYDDSQEQAMYDQVYDYNHEQNMDDQVYDGEQDWGVWEGEEEEEEYDDEWLDGEYDEECYWAEEEPDAAVDKEEAETLAACAQPSEGWSSTAGTRAM